MVTPDLQSVGQKYRCQTGTCNWYLKWGQSCETDLLLNQFVATLGTQCHNGKELQGLENYGGSGESENQLLMGKTPHTSNEKRGGFSRKGTVHEVGTQRK